jgi:hypothetical protein
MLVSDSFSDQITMMTVNRIIYFHKTSSRSALWSPSDPRALQPISRYNMLHELIE